MEFKDKQYIECTLNLLIEVDDKIRDKVMKKINGIIASATKDEKVIHISKNINLITESDVLLSMALSNPSDIN